MFEWFKPIFFGDHKNAGERVTLFRDPEPLANQNDPYSHVINMNGSVEHNHHHGNGRAWDLEEGGGGYQNAGEQNTLLQQASQHQHQHQHHHHHHHHHHQNHDHADQNGHVLDLEAGGGGHHHNCGHYHPDVNEEGEVQHDFFSRANWLEEFFTSIVSDAYAIAMLEALYINSKKAVFKGVQLPISWAGLSVGLVFGFFLWHMVPLIVILQ